ncbi:MAG: DUF1549 domain-containing protein, partial [Verrucomicrobiales bacterium]|nr:DUF1549 domain-containing protein [Verrucomicrobiales bacterium]
MPISFHSSTLCMLFAGACMVSASPDFESQVRPILEQNCVRCHGSGKDKGGLAMNSASGLRAGGDSGPGMILGDPDNSELIRRIELPPEHDETMPQESARLSDNEIQVLRTWIEAGAKWPEGIKLQAVKEPDEPLITFLKTARPPETVAESVDFLDRILAAETRARFPSELEQTQEVSDLKFLRRATIDVIGRIPTHSEVLSYQSAEKTDRREDLIDRLIADPRFSDRWAVFFSDMLRVRTGLAGGRQLFAFLHKSLEENKPYDLLAKELIAANGRPSQNPAVGFVLADDADPMTLAGATSQIFLGVRLACAECHDHPFDDWNQRQFYELAAFFGKTKKIENNFANTLYAIEGTEMKVKWPPERDQSTSRSPVDPLFPFRLVTHSEVPDYIRRLRDIRGLATSSPPPAARTLDDLLD